MQAESTSLYFKDARSDKEYHVHLEQVGDLFMVRYQNGKRGGTLAEGKKTETPVPYAEAKKAYDATVKEKTRKGYTPGEAGVAYHSTELEQRATGIVPQLLNPIGEEDVASYINDPDWVAQEKHDGHRRLVHRKAGTQLGINRRGLSLGLVDTIVQALDALKPFGDLTLDGELMGSVYAIFDVLELEGRDLRSLPYDERLVQMERLRECLVKAGITEVFVTKTAYTAEEKRALAEDMKRLKREGFVFKRRSAPYVPGKPSSKGDQLKRVFWHRATLVVTKPNAKKRSVSFHGFDHAGNVVQLGNVTIPSNYPVPATGELIEIEYRHANPGGSIYQPQYKGTRDDIELAACTLDQLVFREASEDDDDEA
jgi:bifunctional non-homologous end joining protein LigD